MADKTYKLVFTLSDGSSINAGTFVAPQGERGAQGDPGANGAPGKDGTNGITPTIGANGNWFLGSQDTNKPSRGEQGDPGARGPQGVSVTGATVTEVV